MSKKSLSTADAAFLAAVLATTCQKDSDDALRQRLLVASADHRLSEAFALLGEIIYRCVGLKLSDSQYLAARALEHGAIVQLATGEGKTLAAVLPAILAALTGHQVHILTWNDYLAQRDCQLNQTIYDFCGLKCGFITALTPLEERRSLYQLPLIYTTIWQLGYDMMRDFLAREPQELLRVPFDYAIVDEADALMLDAAVNPLVLAKPCTSVLPGLQQITALVAQLPATSVTVDTHAQQVYLTDEGLDFIETRLDQPLYAAESEWPPLLYAALQARFLLRRDQDYLIQDGQLRLIDPANGRQAKLQKYPHLLQSAVELKEALPLTPDAVLCQSITIPHLLQHYAQLCGMTGTAYSAREQFQILYRLPISIIASQHPTQRLDHPPVLCPNASAHRNALLEAIQAIHQSGQPILIGTRSVAESEQLSRALDQLPLAHHVLNAKNDAEEAAIIAQAGQPYAITVSTNMAGRGVDIPLTHKSALTGGLYVLGTGFYSTDRWDDQLRGRSARQGDPGESRFFIDLTDPSYQTLGILRRGTPQELARLRRLLTAEDDQVRLTLLRYSAIAEKQRRLITQARLALLEEDALVPRLTAHAPSLYQTLTDTYGQVATARLEKQLLLCAINDCWSDYLESLALIREGIHLTIIGCLNPLDEYHKLALAAFAELKSDIIQQVLHQLNRLLEEDPAPEWTQLLPPPITTILTYRIDESRTQFSALPRLSKALTRQAQGTLFSLRSLWQRLLRQK